MSSNTPYDLTLSTDEFNKPRVLKGTDAVGQFLVHLILCEPGTFSNRPRLGVGLISKYRYMTNDDLPKLENDISEQILTYLPEFKQVEVNISMIEVDGSDHELEININLDGTIYKYETSKQSDNNIGLFSLL